MVVWRFVDGKRGHENQSLGLTLALARERAVQRHDLPCSPVREAALGWMLATRAHPDRPDPDLVVGAGHGTHLDLLWARRSRGGRSVVLMRPSLPARLFDLCIVPEHDGLRAGANVISTRGVLSAVVPARHKEPGSGLILLGGPSAHFVWREPEVVDQVRTILDRCPDVHWTISGSRRTPASTVEGLRGRATPNVDIVDHTRVDADWLPGILARTEVAWVSEDSVSMIYEALSAGAATGLIAVPRRRESRVSRGVDALVADGQVLTLARWQEGAGAWRGLSPLEEATRCARQILERFAR